MGSIPPLSDMPVTEARIDAAADNLQGLADAAESGDLALAQTLFFGETHNLTHDIDPPLRETDDQLATAFCDNILTLENELPAGMNIGVIQTSAENAADQLQQAKGVLGDLP
jgi:hypothetical protein